MILFETATTKTSPMLLADICMTMVQVYDLSIMHCCQMLTNGLVKLRKDLKVHAEVLCCAQVDVLGILPLKHQSQALVSG
eukprot:4715249-Amphidinium_carterae.1